MIFKQVPVGTFQNFAYIIGDEKTGKGALVDPAWEVDRLLKQCQEFGLKVIYVFNTHSHHDHIGGNEEVREKTGAKVVAYKKAPSKKDVGVQDGNTVDVGSVRVKIIHTPGHCPDHICLLADNKLITGDLLFVGECGRTDLPGGDSAEMYDSLFKKILPLHDSIEVYPGHDYGSKPSSTVGEERRTNYTLRPRTREEFIEFMSEP